MWGSETGRDKGHWVKLEAVEEEQILNAIGGEHVPSLQLYLGEEWEKEEAGIHE